MKNPSRQEQMALKHWTKERWDEEVNGIVESISFGLYTLKECLDGLRENCHFEMAKRVQLKWQELNK